VLRIAAPAQLRLAMGDDAPGWEDLSEPARAEVLRLLARLIARGVVDEEGSDG